MPCGVPTGFWRAPNRQLYVAAPTTIVQTAHLLEGLDVPDEVLQSVQPLLHREDELVVDGAQEIGHLFVRFQRQP